jgi:electron transfer flavoprotein alpha subunit
VVDIKRVEVVAAINQDPKARIFEFCDLGLVGDFKEVVSPLIKAVQNYRKERSGLWLLQFYVG